MCRNLWFRIGCKSRPLLAKFYLIWALQLLCWRWLLRSREASARAAAAPYATPASPKLALEFQLEGLSN